MSRPPLTDLVLAACGAALTALFVVDDVAGGTTWYGSLYALLHAGLSAALLVRSTWRRGSFVATYALLAAMSVLLAVAPLNLGVSPIILCAPLALYKVARHDPPAWGIVALLLGVAGSFVSPVTLMPGGAGRGLVPLLILGMVGTYLWAAGRRRTELAYADRLDRARAEHEREAERRVALARSAERERIAREVHDIVAHCLAVVNVQAATALAIGTETRMRESLTGVRDASKDALEEVRSFVTVLRDDAAPTEVSGDLHRLDALVDEATRAGVRLRTDLPDAQTLERWQERWPAPVRLAAVRVVQETLSNVLKHGGPAPSAHLRVADDAGACLVEVRNDARAPGDSGGFGLVGLHERVELVGGDLDAGPDGEGFAVRARIPTTPAHTETKERP